MAVGVCVRDYFCLILWVMLCIKGHHFHENFFIGTPVVIQIFHLGYRYGNETVTFDICHPSGQLMISQTASGCFIHDEFKDRIFITTCYRSNEIYFTLEDLRINDSGLYRSCNNSTFIWSTNITVVGRRTVIKPNPTSPRLGESLCLSCEMPYNGWTHDEIGARWISYKNGTRRILPERNTTLCLDSLTVYDNGDSYKCTLLFYQGKIGTSDLFAIQLYIPATIETFTANNNARTLEVGIMYPMRISCSVLTSLPTNVTIRYVTGAYSDLIETSKEVTVNVSSTCNMTGFFECEAVTMYGQKVTKMIDVTIKCPPKLTPNVNQINIEKGKELIIVIPAEGNALNATVHGIHGVNVNQTKREITLSKAMIASEDFQTLNLTVTNELGEDSSHIVIQPSGVPEPPTDLTVSTIGQDSLTLSWIPGFQGGSSQNFTVEYRRSNQSWQSFANVTTPEFEITYIPYEQYYFRIKGYNDEGESSWSSELSLVTSGNVTVTSLPSSESGSDMDLIVAVATTAVILTCMFISLIYAVIMFYRRNRKERDRNMLLAPERNPSFREELTTGRRLSFREPAPLERGFSARDHSPIPSDLIQRENNVGDHSAIHHPSILRVPGIGERSASGRRHGFRDRLTSDIDPSSIQPRSSLSESLRDSTATTSTGSSPDNTGDFSSQPFAIPRSTVQQEEDSLHAATISATVNSMQ